MTQTPPSDPAGAPSALAAFLRGIERRGALFAELHCGDATTADLALAQALRVFRDSAGSHSFAWWPRLFWRAVLAAPPLRAGAPQPRWAPQFAALGECGSGPRAALLLRLVAGLPDGEAANVLGIAPQTYRLALQQALPRREDGTPDPDAWRALDTAVQDALRTLPAERLAHLARLRQAAAQGRRPDLIGPAPPPRAAEPDMRRPHPLLRALLWGGVAACALAFTATFFWPLSWAPGPAGDPQVRVRALPPAQTPAQRYDPASALLTEPDFELLAQDDAASLPRDPAFLAWLAAGREQAALEADPDAGMRDPMPAGATTHASTPSESESTDVPF